MKKQNNTSGLSAKTKRTYRRYWGMVLCAAMIALMSVTAYASDPISVVNNLSTFIFGLIKAVGIILVGWGVVQVGLSIQSHDASQRSQGFLTLAGGIVIFFAQEILNLIGVS